MLKTIVSENERQSQLTDILNSQNDDLAQIKKNLASITEIKRSLDQLNIDSSTNVEKRLLDVVSNPIETHNNTTDLSNSILSTSSSVLQSISTTASSTKADLTRIDNTASEALTEKYLMEKKIKDDHDIIERIYADVEEIKKLRASNGSGNSANGLFKIGLYSDLFHI